FVLRRCAGVALVYFSTSAGARWCVLAAMGRAFQLCQQPPIDDDDYGLLADIAPIRSIAIHRDPRLKLCPVRCGHGWQLLVALGMHADSSLRRYDRGNRR